MSEVGGRLEEARNCARERIDWRRDAVVRKFLQYFVVRTFCRSMRGRDDLGDLACHGLVPFLHCPDFSRPCRSAWRSSTALCPQHVSCLALYFRVLSAPAPCPGSIEISGGSNRGAADWILALVIGRRSNTRPGNLACRPHSANRRVKRRPLAREPTRISTNSWCATLFGSPSGGFFFVATHIHHVWVWHKADIAARLTRSARRRGRGLRTEW